MATAHGSGIDGPRLEPGESARPRELRVPLGRDPFTRDEALHGSFSSPPHCRLVPNGIWVGECLRYYGDSLTGAGIPDLMVYFSGDVMLRTTQGVRWIPSTYDRRSPAALEAEIRDWGAASGLPAIAFARPGIYGSSGNHNLRRTRREVALIDAALDDIVARHGVRRLHLAGHSGGGHIVASLLNRRRDIASAAISSGAVSVRLMLRLLKLDPPTASLHYDPIDDIDRIPRDPPPVIALVSDPRDRRVPYASQRDYAERLRAIGLEPVQILATAADSGHHVLADVARRVLADCARGVAPAALQARHGDAAALAASRDVDKS